jgi:hypothetical protein
MKIEGEELTDPLATVLRVSFLKMDCRTQRPTEALKNSIPFTHQTRIWSEKLGVSH